MCGKRSQMAQEEDEQAQAQEAAQENQTPAERQIAVRRAGGAPFFPSVSLFHPAYPDADERHRFRIRRQGHLLHPASFFLDPACVNKEDLACLNLYNAYMPDHLVVAP